MVMFVKIINATHTGIYVTGLLAWEREVRVALSVCPVVLLLTPLKKLNVEQGELKGHHHPK